MVPLLKYDVIHSILSNNQMIVSETCTDGKLEVQFDRPSGGKTPITIYSVLTAAYIRRLDVVYPYQT